jgi:UDP-4-amino-4,6-dideoxy-N-acetyl-beta-L-altrosamine transaminase
MIPYGKQDINQADIDAVVTVLKSDFLTQGPAVPRFEDLITTYCGAQYGVAVNSATSALHIACSSLGLGQGDIVWTSPITFVASANCALYCGASVDFVDIDPRTYNLCVVALGKKLENAKKINCLPKIIIPVHFAGQPCDMERIHKLSQEYGFKVIEDASHAIGGRYHNSPIGNCAHSDVTIFSFHPVKIITTGEGGMAVTNDAALAKKMQRLRSHGITREAQEMVGESEGSWYYQQIDLGWNYRMTDIQAALGVEQFNRLNTYVDKRHQLAKRYDNLLSTFPLTIPWQNQDGYSGLHLYPVVLKLEDISKSRKQIFDAMRSKGIGVNIHYIPVHLQPYYSGLGFKAGDFPNAENYYDRTLTLPLFPMLTHGEQDRVIEALHESLN